MARTGQNAECIDAVSDPSGDHDIVLRLCLLLCSLKNSQSPTVVPGAATFKKTL